MASRTQHVCPSTLNSRRQHAHRFIRALRALGDGEAIQDPAAQVWLEGRAGEVSLFVDDVMEGWLRCEISTDAAAKAIDEYLRTLHTTMEQWVGKWYAPTCCGPLGSSPHIHTGPSSERRLRAFDTLADTYADVPAFDPTEELLAQAV
jgi:hypothetical protein